MVVIVSEGEGTLSQGTVCDAAGDYFSCGFGTCISQITIGMKSPSENSETQVNVCKKIGLFHV